MARPSSIARGRTKNVTGTGKPIQRRVTNPAPTSLPRSREKNITGAGKAVRKRSK